MDCWTRSMPICLGRSTESSIVTSAISDTDASTMTSCKFIPFVCRWGPGPFILRLARKIVNEVLARCHASALKMINQLLTMENKAPFTAHDPYLAECTEKLLKEYRSARASVWMQELIEGIEPAPDPYEPGLLYMATARAYFQGSCQFHP